MSQEKSGAENRPEGDFQGAIFRPRQRARDRRQSSSMYARKCVSGEPLGAHAPVRNGIGGTRPQGSAPPGSAGFALSRPPGPGTHNSAGVRGVQRGEKPLLRLRVTKHPLCSRQSVMHTRHASAHAWMIGVRSLWKTCGRNTFVPRSARLCVPSTLTGNRRLISLTMYCRYASLIATCFIFLVVRSI